MPSTKREYSFLGCLLSPRLYGVIVGVVSLWAMMASLSASIYLMVKFNDFKDVPDSLKAYYRYAMVDTILILIGVTVVGFYLVGLYKVNEHYLMPFIVLLVLDFLGYIVSETMLRMNAPNNALPKDRWKQNLMEMVIFTCLFGLTTHIYRIFKHKRLMEEQRFGGYRSISSSAENIGM
ncbi:uncharacterized protein LOC109397721 [Aedes albopictus]|uniref:Secreted protein n=1 Tax=Aedes albopictus TaxID=7160 RepID=A0ABM2A1J9_AEDAL|nr:uncharacterized protein LOC109397721 [Aedes albopictus]